MRDALRRALTRALNQLLPARGRHADPPPPQRLSIVLGPWAKPWPTTTPRHARDRHTPLHGEDLPATRPYVRLDTPTVPLRTIPAPPPRRLLLYAPRGLHL
ncbi:hypothetical protein ACFQ61_12805 [Streptomyces sp. NPDC056500]|uniref:hypothetical protein n=1 Tax=Streptomyces sp. NPDC056500 TaxID=3345840 RepID=UPI003690FD97